MHTVKEWTKHMSHGYFITYFVVMIVPYLLGTLYYHQTAKLYYEDTVSMNTSALHHTAAITDIRLEEIGMLAEQMVINPDVQAFQTTANPFAYPNTYPMIELCKTLSSYYSSNQMIENYFLFFHRGQTCITKKYAYPYKQFYKIYYQDTGLSYEEWLSGLKDSVSSSGWQIFSLPMSGKIKTCLAYAKPLLSINGDTGFLLITLNQNTFANLFSAIDISDGGALYIQDYEGKLLYSNSTLNIPVDELREIISLHEGQKEVSDKPDSYELTIEGQKMLVTSTTTYDTHCTYVFVQQAASITTRVHSLRILLVSILVLALLLGTILCYLMSRKSARPLDTLLKELSPAKENTNFEAAFERIHTSWLTMASHNKTIEETLLGQLPYLRYTFLSRLLRRDFSSPEELEKLADFIHFEYKDKRYAVLLVRICSDALPSVPIDPTFYMACRLAVTEAIQVLCPQMLFSEQGTDQIVCLYTLDASLESSLQESISMFVTKLIQLLPDEAGNSLCFYVGKTVASLNEVINSFEHSKSMLQKKPSPLAEIPIVFGDNEMTSSTSYFYPYDIRGNLIQYTLTGQDESLHSALHDLLDHNIVKETLPSLLFEMFLNDLTSTLLAIMTQMNLPSDTWQEMYQDLETISRLDALQKTHRICEMFQHLCRLAASRNAETESDFIHSVTTYIRTHYESPEFSLSVTANHFHVNESRLSLSFKQYTGTTFSCYLETLRMERSKELLCTTSKTITDISVLCGYYSANSFCRAFKRFWGYTPTQCRNGTIPIDPEK